MKELEGVGKDGQMRRKRLIMRHGVGGARARATVVGHHQESESTGIRNAHPRGLTFNFFHHRVQFSDFQSDRIKNPPMIAPQQTEKE